jgi:8-oxo-dGTP diphosphatase
MESPRLVVAGLIKKGPKYLLVKETFKDSKDYWVIPGGGVEYGETLEQALQRELKEELGVEVKVKQFLGFKEAIFLDHDYHTIIFFYLVSTKDKPQLLDDSASEIGLFSISEIKDLPLVDSAWWLFKQMGSQFVNQFQ